MSVGFYPFNPGKWSVVTCVLQANMGAKNHAVVMPDAHHEAAVNALAGAAFGAAGNHSDESNRIYRPVLPH
jgi:acyl-CoA reductase-like NAD-dependent aldehyde dehydrogenase